MMDYVLVALIAAFVSIAVTLPALAWAGVRDPTASALLWGAASGLGGVGVLGAAASVFYFLSTHAGPLSIVAVLTSLYPAVTVLLAASLLREAISRRQSVGLALAGLAVVLIVLG